MFDEKCLGLITKGLFLTRQRLDLFQDNILQTVSLSKLFFCVFYEIRAAIRKMRLGKATGPGSISVELLEALEDFEIDKITKRLNKMNGTRHLSIHIHRMIVTWMQ